MADPQVLESFDGEPVHEELRPLLLAVHATLGERPVPLGRLHETCDALLRYLASPEGRTNANCWATSTFFLLNDAWDVEALALPDAYADILSDIAGALHDTFPAPDIAESFESTPELLLVRLRTAPDRAS